MNEYQELIAAHQEMQKRLSDQPLTLQVEEVQTFVKKVREAGAQIRDVRQREQLRAILRSWGAFMFERAGYYPETQLASYDGPTGPELSMPIQTNWMFWLLGLASIVVVVGVVVFIVLRLPSARMSTATPTASTLVSPAPATQSTPADTFTPSIIVGVVVAENATLRSSPDASGVVIGLVPRGLQLTVLARSTDSAWLKVRAADETTGWITPGEIGFSRAQVAQVPPGVVLITPTPTPLLKPGGPTPTATLTPQPTALYVVVVLDSQPVRDSGRVLNLRTSRNVSAELVDRAAIGEQLTVYQRVPEADGTTWLLVKSQRGKQGWARENEGETLLVARPDQITPTPAQTSTPEPSATLTPTGTATPSPISAVRPTPAALAVSVLAQVTPPEGTQLKVRDKPSTAGNILGELDKDAQVVILEGPTRADGLVWWRVDSGKGLVGWSAEGVGDAKYLVPVGWAR